MTAEQPPPNRRRPTRADQEAFQHIQATVWDEALADVKVWRSGYAILATAITAILALIGTQLDSGIAWGWRLALSLTLGAAVVFVGRALLLTLRIEGGKNATSINLDQIVKNYNSVEMYRADQAATALTQLDRSKGWAAWGAACCLAGLILTVWMTYTPNGGTSPAPSSPTSSPTASITPTHTP